MFDPVMKPKDSPSVVRLACLGCLLSSWGVMPGVKLQVGSGVGLDWKPTVTGPDGQHATVMKSLPAPAGAGATPGGTGVFITVDLLKAPFVPAPIRAALGGETTKK